MRVLTFGASIFLSTLLTGGAHAHAITKKSKAPEKEAKVERKSIELKDRDMAVLKRHQAIGTFRNQRLKDEQAARQKDVDDLKLAKGSLHWGFEYGKVDLGIDGALKTANTKLDEAKKASSTFYDGDNKVYTEIRRRIFEKAAPLEKEYASLHKEYEIAYKAEESLRYALSAFKGSDNQKSVEFLKKEGERLGVGSITDTIVKLEKDYAVAAQHKTELSDQLGTLKERIDKVYQEGQIQVKTAEMAEKENAARKHGSEKVAAKKSEKVAAKKNEKVAAKKKKKKKA
jgi:hypothetical protein